MSPQLWLIRHGETAWTLTGQHTGRTDLPLTAQGEERAVEVGRYLAGHPFALVLTSPLQRARETCRIAGLCDVAQVCEDLHEWDYGDCEGRTTPEIREEIPGWSIWDSGCPNGEPVEQVGERAQRVIDQAAAAEGDVALFAHGHILRILAATWLGLPPVGGRYFGLGTAGISILGHERETRVIQRWNLSVSPD